MKLDTIRNKFAAFDLGAIAEQLAKAQAEVDRIDAAIEAAQSRQRQIVTDKAAIGAKGDDATAIVEALIADPTSPTVSAQGRTLQLLDQEFEGLRAALAQLQARRREAAMDLDTHQMTAFSEIAELAQPLAHAMNVRVAEAIEELVSAYADQAAISQALRVNQETTDLLRRVLQAAFAHGGTLVKWRRTAEVSPEIRDTLEIIASKNPNLPIAVERLAYLP